MRSFAISATPHAQADPESRTTARAGLVADTASPILDGDPAEEKAETRAARAVLPVRELLEEPGQEVGRHARTLVLDAEGKGAVVATCLDADDAARRTVP